MMAKDWALDSSLSTVLFESGVLLQGMIEAMKPIPDCQIEIPSSDRFLDFHGYSIVSCGDDPNVVRLELIRINEGIGTGQMGKVEHAKEEVKDENDEEDERETEWARNEDKEEANGERSEDDDAGFLEVIEEEEDGEDNRAEYD
jgi:hypothetical protein